MLAPRKPEGPGASVVPLESSGTGAAVQSRTVQRHPPRHRHRHRHLTPSPAGGQPTPQATHGGGQPAQPESQGDDQPPQGDRHPEPGGGETVQGRPQWVPNTTAGFQTTLLLGGHAGAALDVLNRAPRGTTLNWTPPDIVPSNVLRAGPVTPPQGPRATVDFTGTAPGTASVIFGLTHQAPDGGVGIKSEGPHQLEVQAPIVDWQWTRPGAADGADDASRVRIGERLELHLRLDNVGDVLALSPEIVIRGAGNETALRGGDVRVEGGRHFIADFVARTVGPQHIEASFRAGGMRPAQALRHSFDTHVESTPEEFDRLVNEAKTTLIEHPYHLAAAANERMARAYASAWRAHTKALSDAAAEERLIGDFILGAAFAFIPGGVGGLFGDWVKRQSNDDKFLVDAAKDLLKWGMRRAGQEHHLPGLQALRAFPPDPAAWSSRATERVHTEAANVLAMVGSWQTRMNDHDPDFFLDFDPRRAVRDAMRIGGRSLQEAAPTIAADEGATAHDFEQGWWDHWLRQYGRNYARNRMVTMLGPIEPLSGAIRDRLIELLGSAPAADAFIARALPPRRGAEMST